MRAVMTLAVALIASLLPWLAQASCNTHGLRLAVVPERSMAVLSREYRPLLDHLSDALQMPVDMLPMTSYESVIDAIVSGGVDVAALGPASYILAYRRNPHIEPFASLAIREGLFTPGGHHYLSLLLVRGEGVRELTALHGSSLALSDPASTSGSLIPNREFPAQVGMPLAKFFGAISYSGSHDKSLDALLEGRVDAAFVASVRADTYLNDGRIHPGSLRVLWRSQPIYYDPYVFSSKLCPELKARIRHAMLERQGPLQGFFTSQQATGFAPVGHEQYRALLELVPKQDRQ